MWPDASAIVQLHWASGFYAHVPALYTHAHMAAASRRSGCSRRDVYLPVAIVRVVASAFPRGPRPVLSALWASASPVGEPGWRW